MKTLVSLTIAALAFGSIAPMAAVAADRSAVSAFEAGSGAADQQIDRRRPRVPGGSGCDDPRDLIQHPECR